MRERMINLNLQLTGLCDDYEDIVDEGYDVDWDHSYIDWDIDHDWAAESLGNQLEELDKDDVIDDITIED